MTAAQPRFRRKRTVTRTAIAALLLAPLLLLTAPPAEAREVGARWSWPLDDRRLIRPFLAPAQPWGPGHRGVDLAGSHGAPVRSAGSGIVTFAGMVAGRGVVTVSHGSLRTTYEPVDPVVKRGDAVAAGSPLGVLSIGGQVGGHCVPEVCLHLGLLSGSRYLDPMSLFRPVRVRLLPLPSEAFTLGGGRSATP